MKDRGAGAGSCCPGSKFPHIDETGRHALFCACLPALFKIIAQLDLILRINMPA